MKKYWELAELENEVFWGGHLEFFKLAILNFFLLHISEKPSPFIWDIIFFCTMDGFARILEKKGGGLLCTRLYMHSSPRWLAGEKKCASYNHKTTIWVCHEYYLNPEFLKIWSRAFWVIAILVFSPYTPIVDFKGLTSSKVLEKGFWA